jgi:hypothetical protein
VAGRLGLHLGGFEALGAVLLPDLRPDHCSDLPAVAAAAAAAVRGGVRRGLLPVYAFGRPEEAWRGLAHPGVLDVRRFGPEDTLRVEGWTFRFAPLRHGWPGVALRAEPAEGGGALGLVGLADRWAEDPHLVRLCAGVRLLVVEVGGPKGEEDERLAGGLPAEEAARLAARCGAERLLLGHLEPDDDPEALVAAARTVFPRTDLALEGRTYRL